MLPSLAIQSLGDKGTSILTQGAPLKRGKTEGIASSANGTDETSAVASFFPHCSLADIFLFRPSHS